jgi:hypothetical protein
VAEHFVQTVSQLSGRPIVFITHQLPKGLNVDEAVVLGKNDTNQAKNFNSTQTNRTEKSMREITNWVVANNSEWSMAA